MFAGRNIRSIRALIFKYLHQNNTEVYHQQVKAFVDIIISRINRVTKLAPNQVKNSDESFLVSLQSCNAIKKPKSKLGQNVQIRHKIDVFHGGYCIQSTEKVFQMAAVETLKASTYSLREQKPVDSRKILRERASTKGNEQSTQ